MQRPSLLVVASVLSLSSLAVAAPAHRDTWASGRLKGVDPSAKTVVVTQGSHEMTFTLAPDAKISVGKKSADSAALTNDVGRGVRVRYAVVGGSKIADRVQVSESHASSSTHKPAGK